MEYLTTAGLCELDEDVVEVDLVIFTLRDMDDADLCELLDICRLFRWDREDLDDLLFEWANIWRVYTLEALLEDDEFDSDSRSSLCISIRTGVVLEPQQL